MGMDFASIMIQDSATGEVRFYAPDGQGGLAARGETHGLSGRLQFVSGIFLDAEGYTDFLAYDPDAGTGQFYTLRPGGGLFPVGPLNTGWRRSWRMVTGRFATKQTRFSPILMYCVQSGDVEVYLSDGKGGLVLDRGQAAALPPGRLLFPGEVDGESKFFEIATLDTAAQRGAIYALGEDGRIVPGETEHGSETALYAFGRFGGPPGAHQDLVALLPQGRPTANSTTLFLTRAPRAYSYTPLTNHECDTGRAAWTGMISGRFVSSSPLSSLFLYDGAAGEGQFFTTDGKGNMAAVGSVVGGLPKGRILKIEKIR